ncbi:hypothetical protein IQ265_04380 [Nodosilinea sp. LEGE 06152]|uniref:hypothetical protein n=1 Tax=Nodosilinea sp. LEGE 06152 TaxID=2777966 RepID=UPI001883033C|nr:hypothetical protein [Nodosilinea sp. LEGE 06152]MBE9156072.1 hypothetical protein [Nodosilinea sp. LEGE 06152]
MTAKNRDSNSQESVGLDSAMKPLDPNAARQPLGDDVLNEMQPTHESNPSEDEIGETPIEDIDAIAQEGSGSGDRDVLDRQVTAANRSAS